MKNNNGKLPISVGILTWKAYETLKKTLESYRENGLFDTVAEVILFSQEPTEEDTKMASEFGVKMHIQSPVNVGIGQGFSNIVRYSNYDVVLLLENDWVLIEPKEILEKRLSDGYNILQTGFANVVKYRSRKYPGDPLYTRQYMGNELLSAKHLLDCVHWREHPDKDFPGLISYEKEFDVYLAKACNANQTNNPCMFLKSFYMENIAPFAGNGDQLEGKIDGWWQQQDFVIVHGEGLFTHNRIDR